MILFEMTIHTEKLFKPRWSLPHMENYLVLLALYIVAAFALFLFVVWDEYGGSYE